MAAEGRADTVTRLLFTGTIGSAEDSEDASSAEYASSLVPVWCSEIGSSEIDDRFSSLARHDLRWRRKFEMTEKRLLQT